MEEGRRHELGSFGVRWLLLLLLLANKFGFNTKTHKYCLLWYKVDHIFVMWVRVCVCMCGISINKRW